MWSTLFSALFHIPLHGFVFLFVYMEHLCVFSLIKFGVVEVSYGDEMVSQTSCL